MSNRKLPLRADQIEPVKAMNDPTRAVERALRILLCFSRATPELSMTQISEQVGLHKSTVHRMLTTLEQMRFVERDALSGMYRPGIALVQMAFLTLEHNDLRRIALPYMRKLSQKHRETVDLSLMEGADVIFVDSVESPQRVKLAPSTGQRAPAFCTASGKAILAFYPDDYIRQILDQGMPIHSPATITTPEQFFQDIALVRRDGYSISEQELEPSISAISAPIFSGRRAPEASLAIVGPAYRLTREVMLAIGPDLVAACESIGRELQMSSAAPRKERAAQDEQETGYGR